MKWGSFPSGWLADLVLPRLEARAGLTGTHIGALKIYLAISLSADFHTRKLEISNDDLTVATNLSRPMLKRSLGVLVAAKILAIHASRPLTYELLDPAEGRFAQVPYGRASQALRKLANRGESVLAALKIYLTLLWLRDTTTGYASIGHEKLQQYTGVRPNLIRAGLDHLVIHGLIHIQVDEAWSRTGRQVHRYRLLGYQDPVTPVLANSSPSTNPFVVQPKPSIPGTSVFSGSTEAGLPPPAPWGKQGEDAPF